MQIGQGVEWTRREPTVVVLLWDLPWFLGIAGNRFLWLWVLLKQSTFHYVWNSVKERLFEIFLQTYLDMRWTPTLSIAITRVVWSSEKVSNVFTKLLARTKVEYFHERLFLVENASPVERECWWLHVHKIFSRSFSSWLSWGDVSESPCDGCLIILSSELRWHVWYFFVALWIELRLLEMVSSWTHMYLVESTWDDSQDGIHG